MENLSSLNELGHPLSRSGKIEKIVFYALGLIIFFSLIYSLFLSAPADFPDGIIVNIAQGESLRSVSRKLKSEHIIRSQIAFEAFVIIYGGEKNVNYSDYLFETKLPVWSVARRISKGERHLAPVKVTIPEGYSATDISNIFASKLANFNEDKFMVTAKELEGYLFPDTYFFSTLDDEQDVLRLLSENFEKKIAPIRGSITSSGKTEKQIIIMASLIEREAEGELDRGFISGILWKRIALGMPLQVDAAPETYKTKGLPGSPISNPGLESIKAAIYPQHSLALYYLHDKAGNIHYAKTFAEHRQNILKYLK